ncbi:MAG TPA: hypothetical protein VFQ91_17945 [Bryobacteraceae bacterium]|nr:hypothetical protein [Bryobacteraceae bacterium]
MVFEVVFFFVSLFVLGLWLLTSDTVRDARHWYRACRVRKLMEELEGAPVALAETLLGPPLEVDTGASGRTLYVWKGPDTKAIPDAQASPLLIVTLTVDSNRLVIHAGWEER